MSFSNLVTSIPALENCKMQRCYLKKIVYIAIVVCEKTLLITFPSWKSEAL
ncbi:hypothetical protein HOLleu_30441 [Holothuria leucospilota]|uniref:Uncharacterized protein n=1 Tax=Holothuria leucospilota TaxID=206669 RepID=A0A9Q1BKF6_HOLLE|nr:hypothetical protein HOLleu_30441 [Holothuria leucospilota]